MNLTEQLSAKRDHSSNAIPADKLAIMHRNTAELKALQPSANALATGQTLPNFTLSNSNGESVSLENYQSDYLVVSFYRGGWCPYCNLELKALQGILPELSELNAELIAITPETPDNSSKTSEKNESTFTILSDINNVYAKELGLAFQLSEELVNVYSEFGIDLVKHNNNNDSELPMPATYIVNKNRDVVYSFVPEDYTERLDPNKILEVLKQ